MISIDAWRARIGCWASRIRQKSNKKRRITIKSIYNIICLLSGLSVALSSIVIILILLIIGGIEINPGPNNKDNYNSKDTAKLEQTVPNDISFSDYTYSFRFEASSFYTTTSRPTRYKYGNKKRAKKFPSRHKFEKNDNYTSIRDSQLCITEKIDELEVSPKFPKVSEQTPMEVVSLNFDTHHHISDEIKPKLTTAQGKIFPCQTPLPQYEDIAIFNVDKQQGRNSANSRMENLANPNGTFLIDLSILEGSLAKIAVCKSCNKGRIGFRHTKYANGLAKHFYIICDQCHSSTDFYNLPIKAKSPDNVTQFPHNTLQILGGRLAGIGKAGLDMINSIIGLPPVLGKTSFYKVQSYLSHVSAEYAKNCCKRASQELRIRHPEVPNSDFLKVAVSYDGAYQKRSSRLGGGFSRYCFSSAISVETGKVLNFEVACNSCRYCVMKQQALKEKRLSIEDFNKWKEGHSATCQASEYGKYNSVALESQLAPVIFRRSIEDHLIYETIIADGDCKSVSILEEQDVYGQFGVKIRREECLSHVQKRVRIHLVEKQKDFIAANKTLMLHELSSCNSEAGKKKIREKYRPVTLRDLKGGGRDLWGEVESESLRLNEINLLPDSLIDRIVSLYGFVIKSNSESSLEKVRKCLLAIIDHMSANEKNCVEMHSNCNPSESSFCVYQRALANNSPIPKHPRCLSAECRSRVLGILEPYFNENFLAKVIGGNTSNLNENLHGMLWNIISKTNAIDLDLMNLGASIAVIRFNEGMSGIVKFIESLELSCFSTFLCHSSGVDKCRVSTSVLVKDNTKRRWSLKKAKRSRKRIGSGYKSGAFTFAAVNDSAMDDCKICRGTEDTGVLIKSRKNTNVCVDDWLECSICNCWYHVFCLNYFGVDVSHLSDDEIFVCHLCDKS